MINDYLTGTWGFYAWDIGGHNWYWQHESGLILPGTEDGPDLDFIK